MNREPTATCEHCGAPITYVVHSQWGDITVSSWLHDADDSPICGDWSDGVPDVITRAIPDVYV